MVDPCYNENEILIPEEDEEDKRRSQIHCTVVEPAERHMFPPLPPSGSERWLRFKRKLAAEYEEGKTRGEISLEN